MCILQTLMCTAVLTQLFEQENRGSDVVKRLEMGNCIHMKRNKREDVGVLFNACQPV